MSVTTGSIEILSKPLSAKKITSLEKSEVDFFGGEPLMCLQTIKNVVAYARGKAEKSGKKFLFTTTTNALLLDDDAIDFFNREIPFKSFSISSAFSLEITGIWHDFSYFALQ